MAIPNNQRTAFLQLLRNFIDTLPEGQVVSAQQQNGTRPTGEAAYLPALERDVAVHDLNGNKVLVFVAHRVGEPVEIPRIVRDGAYAG
mgnify:CR=1 FL=1